MMITLLQIPYTAPLSWTDYISAAGNVATAATFIYIIIKEFITRKQVTDLTVIVKELSDQNRLLRQQMVIAIRPIIKAIHDEVISSFIDVNIKNEGGLCRGILIEPSKDLKIVPDDYPHTLQLNEWFTVRFEITNQKFVSAYSGYEIAFFIFFEDILGNKYKAIIARKSGLHESAFVKAIEEVNTEGIP